ncbi:MAG: TGS domain-containing protein [Phormidesmis sp.]
MRHKLSLLTDHAHAMVAYETLAQIILCLGFPEGNQFVEDVSFSAENLNILVALIRARHVLVEQTPYTFVHLSEYFEAVFADEEHKQQHLINISKEILGVKNQIYHFEYSIEIATRLKPRFKSFGLSFRDCLDLVVVSMSNAKFYISAKKAAIEACIASFDEDYIDLKGLQIHDIDSFVSYVENDTTYLDSLANQDLIQVYTREGKPIAIQRSATPVDFAYRIHTVLGNTCSQARVTRNYSREDEHSFDCELDYSLEDGDKVEIIKRADGVEKPNLAWCKFVVTPRAHDAIHAFWNKEHISRGNTLLKQAFGDCYLNGNKFKHISHCLHCGSIEELQQQLGAGEITIPVVKERVDQYSKFIHSKRKSSRFSRLAESIQEQPQPPILGLSANTFLISTCCHPMPGEEICGVLGKRATYIHSANCSKIARLDITERKWLNWNTDKCTAVLKVRIKDRDDITRCLLNKMVEHRVDVNLLNLSSAPSLFPSAERTSFANICVLFESMPRLRALLEDIENIQDVMQVKVRKIFPGESVYKNPPESLRI